MYQVRSKVVLVSLQFLLTTSSYSVWLELCITRMKHGVEECRYRYHMAEVPNGLSALGITENGRGKKKNGKQKKEHMGQLEI